MIARPSLLRQACAVKPPAAFVRSAASPSFISTIKTPAASQLLKPTFLRIAPSTNPLRVAAFHTTAKRDLLPAKPQVISGTANDAAPVPEPHALHGAYHWTLERAVSLALIPITVAPFVGTSMYPIMDAALCGLLVIHTHMGFQAVIIDYLPRRRVPKTRALFDYGLIAGSAVVAYGLWEFETNDVGLVEGIKRVWTA